MKPSSAHSLTQVLYRMKSKEEALQCQVHMNRQHSDGSKFRFTHCTHHSLAQVLCCMDSKEQVLMQQQQQQQQQQQCKASR